MRFKYCAFLPLVFQTGCVYGFLYSDTTQPLDLNLRDNPTACASSSLSTKQLQEPFFSPGVRIEWSSCGIGEAALNGDLDTVQYADLQEISVLGGVWFRRIIHVYGDPKDGECLSKSAE